MMDPKMRWPWTALVLASACAAGCLISPDENLWRMRVHDAGTDRVVDLHVVDTQKAEGPTADVAGCLPTGVVATCDPLTPSGCNQGTCYIVLNKGSACVCPAGTIVTGDPCFTTVECAPGNVCAAPSPGTCRRTCPRQDASTCPGVESCQEINGLPKWGYCK